MFEQLQRLYPQAQVVAPDAVLPGYLIVQLGDQGLAIPQADLTSKEEELLLMMSLAKATPQVPVVDLAPHQQAWRAFLLETSFIIAHRLSTIRDADTILVMEHGDIVEQGSHDELITADGTYTRLHAAQFMGHTSIGSETSTSRVSSQPPKWNWRTGVLASLSSAPLSEVACWAMAHGSPGAVNEDMTATIELPALT